jgi:hypothetical protein
MRGFAADGKRGKVNLYPTLHAQDRRVRKAEIGKRSFHGTAQMKREVSQQHEQGLLRSNVWNVVTEDAIPMLPNKP